MTRAKKQFSRRDNMGAGDLKKSVWFDGPVPSQSDSCAGQNAGLGDEDVLEVHNDKDNLVAEDLPAVSSV